MVHRLSQMVTDITNYFSEPVLVRKVAHWQIGFSCSVCCRFLLPSGAHLFMATRFPRLRLAVFAAVECCDTSTMAATTFLKRLVSWLKSIAVCTAFHQDLHVGCHLRKVGRGQPVHLGMSVA